MIIGCPKEIKNQEYRVGITPSSARELINNEHTVLIQKSAGLGSGFSDDEYLKVGCKILNDASDIFDRSDMIVKVKEPQKNERDMLKEGQILYTYLHLAADLDQTLDLMKSGVSAIAYETITDKNNTLPLLAPMSEVAGRLAPQVGSWAMQKANGGCGKLLGGVPGVLPAKITVIGGGMVGTNAAIVAAGMGADVTILDRSVDRMRYLDDVYSGVFKTAYADAQTTEEVCLDADMVIGAVLIPGAAAPKLLSRNQISQMRAGSVLVDVAIDQGGCFETSKATTHDHPTYIVDDVVHYCVANMPGAVAQTSTKALNNATLPFMIELANKGVEAAVCGNEHLQRGLNVYKGKVVYKAVKDAFVDNDNVEYENISDLM